MVGNIPSMTTLTLVGRAPTGPAEQTAGRVRSLLAEYQIAGQDVARAIGMSQSAFSRRLTGEKEFTITEVATLADVLGVRFVWLVAGEGPRFDPNGPTSPVDSLSERSSVQS